MAQKLLNLVDRGTILNEPRRERVTQRVELQVVLQTCRSDVLFELVFNIALAQPVATPCEHIC